MDGVEYCCSGGKAENRGLQKRVKFGRFFIAGFRGGTALAPGPTSQSIPISGAGCQTLYITILGK